MAQLETWLKQDLQKPIQVQYLKGTMFSQDNAANLVGVEVLDNGEPASLSGSVSANVIRSDGGTVAVSGGTISGDRVSVVLPQAAYAVPGPISIIIKLTSGTTVTTLGALVVTVYKSSTDVAVDPGTIIPSIQTLISQIETAVASIPADYSSLWTSLAPAFSDTTAYSAGQYFTYNGHLYRFTADHAAGSFVNTDCTQVDVGNELSALKSAINAIEVNNMFDGATWQFVSISTIDGKTWAADQKYYTCLKLPVKAGQHIYMQPNDTYAYRYTMLTYDTEYNFLSASEEILNAVKTGSEFIISADGYIRIMMQNHGKTTITDALKQVYEAIPFGYRLIEPLENQVAENQSDIATNQVAIADQKLATAGLMDFILSGSESPHYLLWRNGSFDPASGTVITPNYLYRVSSPYIYEVSERLYYTVKTNYRLYVGVLVNGTWSGSWHTGEGSIAAGIKFVLMIGRTTEDTSETADINEFVNAITFKSNVLTAIDDLKNSVDNLESAIDGLEKAVGDPLKETITGTIVNGFYNVGNNTFTQSANFDTLIVNYENTIADYLYSGNIPNQLVAGATFLNSSDSVISYALVGTSSGGLTYTDKSIGTIPDGTSKIAFTTYNQAKLLAVKSVVYGDIYSTKDFVITGDSIETESAGRWAKPLTDAIPFKSYTNCAVGGTCMARVGTNYISSDARVSAMPETADIVLIGGGTNDWGNNVPLGSLSTLNDDSTFAGAVASMITKMQTRYPSALIVFMSNQLTVSPNRHNFDNTEGFINNVGASATDYANMMETVCKYFNIQYINVHHNCAINRLNYTTYILQETNNFNDTVYAHPNDAGAKRMLRIIYNWFRSNKPIE